MQVKAWVSRGRLDVELLKVSDSSGILGGTH